jgi:hypothetical protein
MSLILDALNKSERERDKKGGIPDLTTLHSPTLRNRDPLRQHWVIIALTVISLLLFALLVVTWISNTKPSPTPQAVGEQKTANQPPVIQPTSAVTSTPATIEPAPSVANNDPEPVTYAPPSASSVEAARLEPMSNRDLGSTPAHLRAINPAPLPTLAAQPNAPDYLLDLPDVVDASGQISSATMSDLGTDARALYQPQQDPQITHVPDQQIHALPSEDPPARPSSVDEALARELWEKSKIQPLPEGLLAKTKPQTQSKSQTPPEKSDEDTPDAPVSETLAGYPDTPYLHELPVTTQNNIPTLMYAKHNYQKGWVNINKTELRLGDKTEGVVVERVLADGVVMSTQGVSFKLAALSSWVNY